MHYQPLYIHTVSLVLFLRSVQVACQKCSYLLRCDVCFLMTEHVSFVCRVLRYLNIVFDDAAGTESICQHVVCGVFNLTDSVFMKP